MQGRAAVLVIPLLGGACSIQHYQSIYSDAAVEVRQFNILFVIFLAICAIMYLLVIGFLIVSLARRRRTRANVMEDGRHHESDPLMQSGLIGWGALVATGLIGLAIASFFADRSMANAAAHPKLFIKVTANQWWWDVEYLSSDSSKSLRTANELHR